MVIKMGFVRKLVTGLHVGALLIAAYYVFHLTIDREAMALLARALGGLWGFPQWMTLKSS